MFDGVRTDCVSCEAAGWRWIVAQDLAFAHGQAVVGQQLPIYDTVRKFSVESRGMRDGIRDWIPEER